MLAIPLSLGVIGLAWVFYRPMLGIPLLILTVAGVVGVIMLILKKRRAKAA